MELTLKDRLAFALDVPPDQARQQIELMGGRVGWIKVNSAFIGGGWDIVKMIQDKGSSPFIDLKLHDIPNTIENDIDEMTSYMRRGIINVHATGGRKMMTAAAQRLERLARNYGFDVLSSRPLLLAVTILTSLNQEDFEEVGFSGPISDTVLRLAALAKDCGLDGVVCSAHEASPIKLKLGNYCLTVTPAIRFEEEAKDDQARLATPRKAIANGSDILVMGRSLIKGGLAAVDRALAEIEAGLADRHAA